MAYNILVVDDSSTVRTMIRRVLDVSELPLGEIQEAENGKQALERLGDSWVDLVLTDINMPEMNGMELVRRMATDDMMRSVPVVVISTEGSEARVQELRDLGIQGYLRKPFTPEAVRDLVEGVLRPEAKDA